MPTAGMPASHVQNMEGPGFEMRDGLWLGTLAGLDGGGVFFQVRCDGATRFFYVKYAGPVGDGIGIVGLTIGRSQADGYDMLAVRGMDGRVVDGLKQVLRLVGFVFLPEEMSDERRVVVYPVERQYLTGCGGSVLKEWHLPRVGGTVLGHVRVKVHG